MPEAPTGSSDQISRQTLRTFRRVFCQGDLDAADRLFGPDYVDHDPNGPSAERGPAVVRRFLTDYREAFPDLRLAVEEQVVEGDTVLTRWKGHSSRGRRDLVDASRGRYRLLQGVTVTRFSSAQAVEGWSSWCEAQPGPR